MAIYWTDGTELYHYGIPGMKWGVRRYQNEDGTYTDLGKLRRRATKQINQIIASVDYRTLKSNITHDSNPKKYTANGVIDRISKYGGIETRSYYDNKGNKVLELTTHGHGNPKHHRYGKQGEHAHFIFRDKEGRQLARVGIELTSTLRKEYNKLKSNG